MRPVELDDVRALMRAFVAWHRARHVEDAVLGRVARRIWAVALRDLGEGICEMKRMFVPEAFRGRGVGRALAERVVAEAREAGYRAMRLDTSRRQSEAMTLYEGCGFKRIPPYYALADDVKGWLVFFELTLR